MFELSMNRLDGRNSARVLKLFLSLAVSFLFTACATIEKSKPVAPEVTIESVRPMNLSLTGQKLNFTLRVTNPNSFDLPVEVLEFVASLGGETVAKGVSGDAVTIPAKKDALVDVVVVAGLNTVIQRFKSVAKNLGSEEGINLDYGIKGTVELANWPGKIPFNVTGDLSEKIDKIGKGQDG